MNNELKNFKDRFKEHNLEFKIKKSKNNFLFTLSGSSGGSLSTVSWRVPFSGWLPGMKGKIILHQQTVNFMQICFNALLKQVSDYHYKTIFNNLHFEQLMNKAFKNE